MSRLTIDAKLNHYFQSVKAVVIHLHSSARVKFSRRYYITSKQLPNSNAKLFLHLVNITVLSPSPEALPVIIEKYSSNAPENRESHIGHEDRQEPRRLISGLRQETLEKSSYPDLIVHGVMNLPIP